MITLTIVHGSNDNKSVYPKGTSLNIRQSPSTTGTILITVPGDTYIGTVLGEWTGRDELGYKWYVIKLVQPINGKASGSVREDVIKFNTATIPDLPNNTNDDTAYISATEKLVRNVVAIDVVIYKRLVLIYAQLKKAEALGVDITKQMAVFNLLLQKYKVRQQMIKEQEGLTTNIPAYPLYQWISDKFGLGAVQIPLAVILVGVAIGTLVIAYALEGKFTPAAKGQADDLKITGEFQKFFDLLPVDAQAKIKADLEQQLKDAYDKGASDSSMGIGDILKWGMVGLIGVFIFNQYQQGQDKRNLNKVLNKAA